MADSTLPSEQEKRDAERKARIRENNRRYRQRHPEVGRSYYLKNRERILEKCKQYRIANEEAVRQRHKEYYLKTKENRRVYSRLPKSVAARKKYRQSHAEQVRELHRKWRDKNREHLRKYKKERNKDPFVALIKRVRDRTRRVLKLGLASKCAGTFELLGCNSLQLVSWIESQFTDGMCWERIKDIHMDHVIPLSRFDLSDEYQQRAAFHYTNIRPMWDLENKRKSDKVQGQQLFGFAYADKIASVMNRGKKTGRPKDASRKHCGSKHC